VQRAPRRIPQGVHNAPLSKRRQRRALRATPCTSPLVQRIGMRFVVGLRSVKLFRGLHHRPSSAARPPKAHGPASRRPRPSAESAPPPQPLYCLSTRPTSPPYPAPQLLSPPSPPPSPDPLACDLQLASVAASAARRDSAFRLKVV
jgi:hypothetical protein